MSPGALYFNFVSITQRPWSRTVTQISQDIDPNYPWKSNFLHFCKLLQTKTPFRGIISSEAVCREIGPTLWKIGSTYFVKCVKKMLFLIKWANFQPWSYHFGARTTLIIVKFCRIGKSSKSLRGNTVLGDLSPKRFFWSFFKNKAHFLNIIFDDMNMACIQLECYLQS